jgi:DNA-nicking Smr family endonuclease
MASTENDWQKGVEPLPAPRRVAREPPRPAPLPHDAQGLGPISPDDAPESGRGHWVVEASVDLHGMNRRGAHAAVREFLRECRARRLGCVRIVHGRGLGSRNREPVLKRKGTRCWPSPRPRAPTAARARC